MSSKAHDAAEELRELITEAHQAMKDLKALYKEVQTMTVQSARALVARELNEAVATQTEDISERMVGVINDLRQEFQKATDKKLGYMRDRYDQCDEQIKDALDLFGLMLEAVEPMRKQLDVPFPSSDEWKAMRK